MKKTCVPLILLLLLCVVPVFPVAAEDKTPDEKLAMLAALDFLDLADQGDFAQCWEISSPLFRNKIDKQLWVQEIGHMRPQYGETLGRALQYSKPLDPSADFGNQPTQFLIFRATFAQKTVAELVTLSKDSDNHWRVVGYAIQ